MTRKISVGILFGGRSGEHEVSLQSAASVIKALDPAKYADCSDWDQVFLTFRRPAYLSLSRIRNHSAPARHPSGYPGG